MSRVKRGIMSHKKHKNLLKLTRGYRGTRNNLIRMARQAILNAGQFAYRDRRNKKRVFRSQWINTINIALHSHGMQYSTFMHTLSESGVDINRKTLAELAETDAAAFEAFVKSIAKK